MRGSKYTAEIYLRRLSRFCEFVRISPEALVELKQEELDALAQDAVTELEKQKYLPSYIGGLSTSTASWLDQNHRHIEVDVKITDAGVAVNAEEEEVPEPAQIEESIAASTLRGKASASLICYTGVRPGVLGNVDGTDGLVLGDLPDLDIESLKFKQIPFVVQVRRKLSKKRHNYFTMGNEIPANHIIAYLSERRGQHEQLSAQSPVIRANLLHKERALKSLNRGPCPAFVCAANVEEEIRRGIRRAGYSWRPYILRSYFDTKMLEAEMANEIAHPVVIFFMGHKGDIERTYTLNKGKLPDTLMRQIRIRYSVASTFLTGEAQDRERLEQVKQEAQQSTRQEIESRYEERIKSLEYRIAVQEKMEDIAIEEDVQGHTGRPRLISSIDKIREYSRHLEDQTKEREGD